LPFKFGSLATSHRRSSYQLSHGRNSRRSRSCHGARPAFTRSWLGSMRRDAFATYRVPTRACEGSPPRNSTKIIRLLTIGSLVASTSLINLPQRTHISSGASVVANSSNSIWPGSQIVRHTLPVLNNGRAFSDASPMRKPYSQNSPRLRKNRSALCNRRVGLPWCRTSVQRIIAGTRRNCAINREDANQVGLSSLCLWWPDRDGKTATLAQMDDRLPCFSRLHCDVTDRANLWRLWRRGRLFHALSRCYPSNFALM